MTNTTAYETALGLPALPPLAATSLGKSADHMMQLIGFHSLYNVPMAPLQSEDRTFSHMDNPRVALRLGLIAEEFKELMQDGFGIEVEMNFTARHGGDGIAGLTSGTMESLPRLLEFSDKRDGAEAADALGDLVYVIYGMALEMGYDLRAVIQEIHGSNMTKLGEDGQPIYREDGKVLKGPNYMKPNVPAALGWEN